MSIFSSIGDIFSNEASHIGNLLGSFGKNPGTTLEQFGLGAEDPLGAKLWGTVLGQNLTPSVGQLGGETSAQYDQSKSQGVNTGPSQTLGAIANVVAGIWGGAEAGGALGDAAGSVGGSAGGDAAGGGTAMGPAAGTLGAADSSAASTQLGLTATDVGGSGSAAAGTGSAAAGAGGAGGSSSSWMDYAKTVGKVLAPTVVSSLLAPKPPKAAAPIAMPDPLAQQQAQQQRVLQQLARRGRASTILTSPGDSSGSLGG